MIHKLTFAYDPDFQAWLDRGTTLGYTLPSDAQKLSINDFFIGLKADGLWSKFDILYWFAIDGSSDMATLNLKSPTTHQITVTTTTFVTNQGFKIQSNGGLDTNFVPSTSGVNYTKDDASNIDYVYSHPGGTRELFGQQSGTIYVRLVSNTSASGQRINSTNNLSAAVNIGTTGYKAITRTSSTAVTLYDGTTAFSRTETSTTLSPAQVTIGRVNGINGVDVVHSCYGEAASLNATEHGNMRTRILNLLAAL